MPRRPYTSEKTLPGTGLPPSPGYFARQRRLRKASEMTPGCADEGDEASEQSRSTRRTRRKVYHMTNNPKNRQTPCIEEPEPYPEGDEQLTNEQPTDDEQLEEVEDSEEVDQPEDIEQHEDFASSEDFEPLELEDFEQLEDVEQPEDFEQPMAVKYLEEVEPVITFLPPPPTPASQVAEFPKDRPINITANLPEPAPRQKRKYIKKPKHTHTLPDWFLQANPAEQFRMTGIMMQHAYRAQLAHADEAAATAIRAAKTYKGIERSLNALMEPGKLGVLPMPFEMLERRFRNTWRMEAGKAKEAVERGQVVIKPVVHETSPDGWVPKRRKGWVDEEVHGRLMREVLGEGTG
ncbi:hypothetical protein F5X68DRAFT_192056 [Plectosphaerella plurivora]|uniref:Uncharacterized protein n=1 Tax=Plectosphaerella plurivora TaxID=936078 RepID=A0A9P8V9H5_9PEZI|nr:hypothetical protein F5X68DRAFT_192056 [Plectosphaerella plurivora]